MRKLILLSLMFCVALAACNDDEGTDSMSYAGGSSKRVKRITGENSVWGKYRLEFNYEYDGILKDGWRMDAKTGDTTGVIKVDYDLNYYLLSIVDYVPGIDADSVAVLKKMYPDTWMDTLRAHRTEQTLCSVELKEGRLTKKFSRPRRDPDSGKGYNPKYVQVISNTQMPELADGKPVVIRCYDNVFGSGADNDNSVSERTVSKYEFAYQGGDLVNGERYFPNTDRETSWRKVSEISFSSYSGIVTGVESDTYKMRR
ncbi:MAG: hypothetical protein RSA53_11740, partial [Odoribacter sp.]